MLLALQHLCGSGDRKNQGPGLLLRDTSLHLDLFLPCCFSLPQFREPSSLEVGGEGLVPRNLFCKAEFSLLK